MSKKEKEIVNVMKEQILVATGNQDKMREIRMILQRLYAG